MFVSCFVLCYLLDFIFFWIFTFWTATNPLGRVGTCYFLLFIQYNLTIWFKALYYITSYYICQSYSPGCHGKSNPRLTQENLETLRTFPIFLSTTKIGHEAEETSHSAANSNDNLYIQVSHSSFKSAGALDIPWDPYLPLDTLTMIYSLHTLLPFLVTRRKRYEAGGRKTTHLKVGMKFNFTSPIVFKDACIQHQQ